MFGSDFKSKVPFPAGAPFPAKETCGPIPPQDISSGCPNLCWAKPQKHFPHLPQNPSLCSLQRHLWATAAFLLPTHARTSVPSSLAKKKPCTGEKWWAFSWIWLSQHCLSILALTGEESFTAPAWKAFAGLSPLRGDKAVHALGLSKECC